jgi:hypothetical protein
MYFTARTHSGEPHDDENDSRHHRAHEQAFDAMNGNNTGDDDHEGPGWTTDLGCRSAQRRLESR